MAKCATSVDHCSETECETSGNDAPCKTFIMRGNYGGRLASCYINGFHWVFMINYFDILHGNICQEDKPCSIYCRGLLGLYQCNININTGTRLNIVLEFILGCLIFYIFPGAKGFTPSRTLLSVPASSRPKGERAHRGHGIKPIL